MKLKVFLLATALLAMPACLIAADQPVARPLSECVAQAPYGWPTSVRTDTTEICRIGYALLHDNAARIPTWVTYTLTAPNSIGCGRRDASFVPDRTIRQGQRSETLDYANSGFDTGHLANNADLSWSPEAARESFILSNAAPQLPSFNRGVWRVLESAIRVWAFNSNSSVTIYTGPIYNNSARRIGRNGVVVPQGFYKIVVDNSTRESLAFMFEHTSDVSRDFRQAQTTVAAIEEATGLRFPVPDNKNARNNIWPIRTAPFLAARRVACRQQYSTVDPEE